MPRYYTKEQAKTTDSLYFSSPYTGIEKYSRVLYVKPSNKLYLLPINVKNVEMNH